MKRMMYERKYGLFCYLVSTQKLQKTACLILGRQIFCEYLNRNIGNPITMYNGNIVNTISLEEIVRTDIRLAKFGKFDNFISKV